MASAESVSGSVYRVRRSVHAQDKPYVCTHPGCKKAFYHRPNLYRHRKDHRVEQSLGLDQWPAGVSQSGGRAMGGLSAGRYLPTFGIFMTPLPNTNPGEVREDTKKTDLPSTTSSASPAERIGDSVT